MANYFKNISNVAGPPAVDAPVIAGAPIDFLEVESSDEYVQGSVVRNYEKDSGTCQFCGKYFDGSESVFGKWQCWKPVTLACSIFLTGESVSRQVAIRSDHILRKSPGLARCDGRDNIVELITIPLNALGKFKNPPNGQAIETGMWLLKKNGSTSASRLRKIAAIARYDVRTERQLAESFPSFVDFTVRVHKLQAETAADLFLTNKVIVVQPATMLNLEFSNDTTYIDRLK